MYLSFLLFRLVSGNLGRWVWARTLRVYKVFTKIDPGPWLRRYSALGNKLHSTICIVLLIEFVSQNAWLQHLQYFLFVLSFIGFYNILCFSFMIIFPISSQDSDGIFGRKRVASHSLHDLSSGKRELTHHLY